MMDTGAYMEQQMTNYTEEEVMYYEMSAEIEELQKENAELKKIVRAVAYIGIDFGYGEYEIEQVHIDNARELLEDK